MVPGLTVSAIHGWRKMEKVPCDTVLMQPYAILTPLCKGLCIVFLALKFEAWISDTRSRSLLSTLHVILWRRCTSGFETWLWLGPVAARGSGFGPGGVLLVVRNKSTKTDEEVAWARLGQATKPVQSFKRTCRINQGFCLPKPRSWMTTVTRARGISAEYVDEITVACAVQRSFLTFLKTV